MKQGYPEWTGGNKGKKKNVVILLHFIYIASKYVKNEYYGSPGEYSWNSNKFNYYIKLNSDIDIMSFDVHYHIYKYPNLMILLLLLKKSKMPC